jgi:hypothetical protein
MGNTATQFLVFRGSVDLFFVCVASDLKDNLALVLLVLNFENR